MIPEAKPGSRKREVNYLDLNNPRKLMRLRLD